jgi:hypothetical protein
MDYLPYLVCLVLLVALGEMYVSSKWKPYYFRRGWVILSRSVHVLGQPNLSPERLNKEYKGKWVLPIVFQALGPREVAFRRALDSHYFTTRR